MFQGDVENLVKWTLIKVITHVTGAKIYFVAASPC